MIFFSSGERRKLTRRVLVFGFGIVLMEWGGYKKSVIMSSAGREEQAFRAFRAALAFRRVEPARPVRRRELAREEVFAHAGAANDLIKAIDRANILSMDRENVVDLTMSENGVEISAKSQQIGSAIERIDVFKFIGQDLRISFNSEFVVAAVKALNSEDVTFAFVGEMKPFIVENASDDSVVQIVTPVRTY